MSKKRGLLALSALLLLMVATPVFAAPQAEEAPEVRMWIAITSGFAMAIASSICGLSQGRAVIAACEGIARNPSAAGQIRGSLIIGLILIESLAIYTLLVALILLFG